MAIRHRGASWLTDKKVDRQGEKGSLPVKSRTIFRLIKKKESTSIVKEEKPMIMVGQQAPDFTAPGYNNGNFVTTKLSDHLGKWVMLFFYPGDFTFV